MHFLFPWEMVSGLIDEELCDASIVHHEGHWFIFASPPTNDKVLLYSAEPLLGPWVLHPVNPVLVGKGNGRPGGQIIKLDDSPIHLTGFLLFVQDCESSYGAGVNGFQISHLSNDVVQISKFEGLSLYGTGTVGDWNRFGMHHVCMFVNGSGRLTAAADGWRLRPPDFVFS